MLSRVADSIYWMSRYVERAENVARFIDVNLHLSLDVGPQMERQWDPLIYTTGDHAVFYERYGVATQENVVRFLTFDDANSNSILSCLRSARENARTVREMLSSQMWEELNKFYLLLHSVNPDSVLASPFEFFSQIKLASYVLEGVTEATMSHGEAWHFRRLGRLLERADKTSRILDVKYFLLLPSAADVGTPLDTNQWGALLKSASALEMYRKRYGRITPEQVAERTVRGQYGPGASGDEKVIGYREEQGVGKETVTETYAAVEFRVSNWRWSGVPFYVRTGKRLARNLTEVKIIMSYRPPLGTAGQAVAKLIGRLTEHQIREDLRAFKTMAEAGEKPTIAGQPVGPSPRRMGSTRRDEQRSGEARPAHQST